MYAQKWVNSLGQVRWQPVFGDQQLLTTPHGWTGSHALEPGAYEPYVGSSPALYRSRRRAERIARNRSWDTVISNASKFRRA